MERKIGEVFKFKNVTLKVVESKSCKKCYFKVESCTKINPYFCTSEYRSDKKDICFIKQD